MGRFITIDDLQYLDPESINGLNLYAYCGNNPVMAVDLEGTKWSWKGFLMVVAAVAVVAATAALIAVTAGGAAVAIAGAAGVTGTMLSTISTMVTATALVCGGVVGGIEIANQVLTKGAEEINLLAVGIKTYGAALDGAMIAGSAFASPIGKSLIGGARIVTAGLMAWSYGVSEKEPDAQKAKDVIQAMFFTSIASVIPFFTKSADVRVLLPQAAVAQFSGMAKAAMAILGKLAKKISFKDLIYIRKIYPAPIGPTRGIV